MVTYLQPDYPPPLQVWSCLSQCRLLRFTFLSPSKPPYHWGFPYLCNLISMFPFPRPFISARWNPSWNKTECLKQMTSPFFSCPCVNLTWMLRLFSSPALSSRKVHLCANHTFLTAPVTCTYEGCCNIYMEPLPTGWKARRIILWFIPALALLSWLCLHLWALFIKHMTLQHPGGSSYSILYILL